MRARSLKYFLCYCVIIIRSLCNTCQIRLHNDPMNDTTTLRMTQSHNDLMKDTMTWRKTQWPDVRHNELKNCEKKVRFLYINIIRVLKRKKFSFLWCNLFKKIMSYVKVINVLKKWGNWHVTCMWRENI